MRLAIDCRSVFQGMGGIGRYAWSLLQEFRSVLTGDAVTCYFTHLPPPAPVQLPENFAIRIIEAGMVDDRFDQFILPTLLEEDRADLYFNPTFSVPTLRGATKVVSTVHDVVFARRPELVEERLRTYLDRATRRAARSADRIVTVSEFSSREIQETYGVGTARIRVIPNGVHAPTAGSGDTGIGRSGRTPLPGYALYVGSLEPKKNVESLVRAIELLHAQGDGPHLVLSGNTESCGGQLRVVLDRLSGSGKVTLTGHVPDAELEGIYARAGVFVYPSLYEGFGLPPLEAMLRGVPTIVSNSTSLPEVVGDAALKVNSEDSHELAASIRTVLRDETLRRSMVEAGRKRAAQFTWRKSAEAHAQLFSEAIGTKK